MAWRAPIAWAEYSRTGSGHFLMTRQCSRLREHPEGPGNGFLKERQMASKTTNPFTFMQQVRQETTKVTWPSRRETLISTAMVLVFAFIAAIFFFAAAQILALGVELILGIGR
jgi:preprotein translocase subunit SecE